MLLRCFLIHINITMLRNVLYLLYLYPCPYLGLFMSYLCDLFLVFIFIFIMINRMNTDILVLLLIFQNMFYYFWMITWMVNGNNFQIAKVQPQGVAWHLLNFLAISVYIRICVFNLKKQQPKNNKKTKSTRN